MARYAKAKRERNDIKYSGIYYNFEIFHMREKGIPVDSLEIKENIQVQNNGFIKKKESQICMFLFPEIFI